MLGLIDSGSGAVHASYSYTPFGRSDQAWQPGENRFRFASGEVDRLGLYYFRARYYSPERRRFINEDPIGLAGGVNPYVYAGNDPINQADPTGLFSQECVEDGTHNCPYRLGAVTGRVRMRGVTLPVSRSPWGWLVPGSLDVDAILAEAGGVVGIGADAISSEVASLSCSDIITANASVGEQIGLSAHAGVLEGGFRMGNHIYQVGTGGFREDMTIAQLSGSILGFGWEGSESTYTRAGYYHHDVSSTPTWKTGPTGVVGGRIGRLGVNVSVFVGLELQLNLLAIAGCIF